MKNKQGFFGEMFEDMFGYDYKYKIAKFFVTIFQIAFVIFCIWGIQQI